MSAHAAGRIISPMSGCGFSSRPNDPDSPICGAPGEWHFLASPDGNPLHADSWTVTACARHEQQAREGALDWHRIVPACDVPGSSWQFGNHLGGNEALGGHSTCIWEAEIEIAVEVLAELSDLLVAAQEAHS